MTAEEAITFLSGFPPDTKVVLGSGSDSSEVYEARFNTYYPPKHPYTVWVVLDRKPDMTSLSTDDLKSVHPEDHF